MNIDKFKPQIIDILRQADLDTISSKKVRKLLQKQTTEPLDAYKKQLDGLILTCVDIVSHEAPKPSKYKQQQQHTAAAPAPVPLSSSPPLKKQRTEDNGPKPPRRDAPKPKPASSASNRSAAVIDSDDDESNDAKTAAPTKKRKRNVDPAKLQKNPFTKTWKLSSTLSDVVGTHELARPAVVKELWRYIKANNLQDPSNKSFVLCDSKLNALFGTDRIHCFTMNKHIGKHLSELTQTD
ncbi:SWIB/MDM2 domain-containing protein [Gongronella butleri]|nr:SWIB/MDM2 domain-containing protein [Gongronella butleri]